MLIARTYIVMHKVALSSTTAATAPAAFHGSITSTATSAASATTGTRRTRRSAASPSPGSPHRRRTAAGRPRPRRCRPARRQAASIAGSTPPTAISRPAQAASTASTPSTNATDPRPRQPLAEKHRRQQRGDHRVHRHHHGAQHRRRAVHQRQVQADEQHACASKPLTRTCAKCLPVGHVTRASTAQLPRITAASPNRKTNTGHRRHRSKQQARQWDSRARRRMSDSDAERNGIVGRPSRHGCRATLPIANQFPANVR